MHGTISRGATQLALSCRLHSLTRNTFALAKSSGVSKSASPQEGSSLAFPLYTGYTASSLHGLGVIIKGGCKKVNLHL